LNRKFDRAQIEIELLRENRERAGLASIKFSEPKSGGMSMQNIKQISPDFLNNPINNQNDSRRKIKLCRQVYSLEEIMNDPLKSKLYFDKLNAQIKQRVR
jgi:hypothetical protein